MPQHNQIVLFLLTVALIGLPVPVQSAEKAEEDADHKAKLDVEVKELVLENVTLEEAMLLLQVKTHANIIVDVKNLESDRYPFDKKIRLHLYDLELGKVLDVLVKAYDESGVHLGFRVRGGVIHVASVSKLQDTEIAVTLVYDIHDLADRFLSPNDLSGGKSLPFDAEVPLVPGQPTPPTIPQRENPVPPEKVTAFTRQGNVDLLTRLILACVDPNSWRDNGGQIGAIKELGGLLLVTQLPAAQKQVESLLKNLRAMRTAIDRGDPDRGRGIDLLKKE